MGPVATTWAAAMRERGHEVQVISAFPHYPPSVGEQRVLPYEELRDGIHVLRLPLLIGHSTPVRRILEEITYAASAAVASVALPRSDAAVVVSPSFVALGPLLAATRMRRIPTVLWLQDILPDAAATTGLVANEGLLAAAGAYERLAYRLARHIVVISEAFARNLAAKGVAKSRVTRIYNPTTRPFRRTARALGNAPLRLLAMGNIGYSQGLGPVVQDLESSDLSSEEVELAITGEGEQIDAVLAALRSTRVRYLGLLSESDLSEQLERADVGLVTQRIDIAEFNLPSKLMTYMALGLPILMVGRGDSEAARIVASAGAGWVVRPGSVVGLSAVVRAIRSDPADYRRKSAASLAFAKSHFSPASVAGRFECLFGSLAR
jgi:colanic acid biosynthesis glycosyl transferase WcaI